MCGRFLIGELQGMLWPDLIELYPPDIQLRPRYNIAPTQDIPAVRHDGERIRLEMMRWGLVHLWIKKMSDSSRMINARAETVSERPAFKGV